MTEQAVEFNPSQFMVVLRGGATYLPVSARKVWLQTRTDHALEAAYAYTIHTDAHLINDRVAVFRAEVTITDDAGTVIRRATGWGTKPSDAHDYVECAETKALGRALANCGFGTDNTDDDDIIVDSPRDTRSSSQPVPFQPRPSGGGSDEPVTDRQWGMYQRVCRERRLNPGDRDAFTKRSMSSEIDRITQIPVSVAQGGSDDPGDPSW